jgi:hypothetical protein
MDVYYPRTPHRLFHHHLFDPDSANPKWIKPFAILHFIIVCCLIVTILLPLFLAWCSDPGETKRFLERQDTTEIAFPFITSQFLSSLPVCEHCGRPPL